MSTACSAGTATSNTGDTSEPQFVEYKGFSPDSAFSFVASQVAFGPRVPGSKAHDRCVDYLAGTLTRFGADTVIIEGNPETLWNGTIVPVRNIRARFAGKATQARPVLLMAHYDTRPWADQDPNPQMRSTPFDGANDGASGVGVILEIARNLGQNPPQIPVEILFTDVEDSGTTQIDDSWCVGARQFALNLPYRAATRPRWGILLDMVGGRDAVFEREYFSVRMAPVPVSKLWDMAGNIGLRHRFPMSVAGAVNDDHLPLNSAGIPTADIIECTNPTTGSFPPTWHTHADNLDNIDPTTLGDVGRTVINVIYNEKP